MWGWLTMPLSEVDFDVLYFGTMVFFVFFILALIWFEFGTRNKSDSDKSNKYHKQTTTYL
jgi:hypothetical protein